MKKFIDHGASLTPCTRVDSPNGRKYVTPAGASYPSVTSIVSLLGAEEIAAWKQRVGESAANEIGRRAATRGTLIHENCERQLRGEPLSFSMFQQTERKMFEHLLPVIDSIEEVHAMESVLYSDKYKFAGTVDLIARIGGELVILDWKTSSRYKTEEDIPGYFTQAAAYALAFYEMTGMAVSKIVIAMTTEEFGLLRFEQPTRRWVPKFLAIREKYAELKGE